MNRDIKKQAMILDINTLAAAGSIPGKETVTALLMGNNTGYLAVNCESGGDFTLPDYMPPIKKILSADAAAVPLSSPGGRFLTDGGQSGMILEFAGTVTYSILYTAENGELYTASLASDYECSTALGASCRPTVSDILIDTGIGNVNCRVVGPRKLSIKTKLFSKIHVFYGKEIGNFMQTPLTGADELSIRRKTDSTPSVKILRAVLPDFELSGSLSVPAETMNPAWCEGKLFLREARPSDGLLNIRGELLVRCLCCGDMTDNAKNAPIPAFTEQRYPFSAGIDMPGLTEKHEVRAMGKCISLNIGNESEASGSLPFDAVLSLEGEASVNTEVSFVTDLYSTACECDCGYDSTEFLSLVKCSAGNFTATESRALATGEAGEVLFTLAEATAEGYEKIGDMIRISGKATVKTILSDTSSGAAEYMTAITEVPLKYEFSVAGSAISDPVCIPKMDVCAATSRCDGTNLSINLEIAVSACVYEKKRHRLLSSASLQKDVPVKKPEPSEILLCYAAPQDTLWEIAKRYHISENEIRRLSGKDFAQPLEDTEILAIGG